MKAFVIAEHSDAAAQLAAGARTVADEVAVAVINAEVPAGIADAAYHVAVPEGAIADDAYGAIATVLDADVVIAEPTRHVKSVVGRLAAAKGAAVITDCLSIADGAAVSMYFGGVAQITRKAKGTAFYTVAPSVFGDAAASGSNGAAEELAWVAPANAAKLVASEPVVKSGVDLTKADVVVACGRGFVGKTGLNTELIGAAEQIAAKTNGGVGCSRPLAEGVEGSDFDSYIGVSGLQLTPKVYICAGISGQMQHMVGCNRSGVIIAINKDKNAPIFKQCDLGVVGSVEDVLPALAAAL